MSAHSQEVTQLDALLAVLMCFVMIVVFARTMQVVRKDALTTQREARELQVLIMLVVIMKVCTT